MQRHLSGFLMLSLLLSLPMPAAAGTSCAKAYIGDLRQMIPQLYSIEFEGTDVIFDERYKILQGKWELWSGRNIEVVSDRWPSKDHNCALPPDADRYGPYPKVLLCDQDDVWFATMGYCSDEREYDRQGAVYVYSKDGNVDYWDISIPRCESVAAAERVGDEIWFGLVKEGGHDTYGGSGILIYDLKTQQSRPLETEGLKGRVIYAIAHNPVDHSVWVTTRWGIHRYALDDRSWEGRLFKPILTPDYKPAIDLTPDTKWPDDITDYWLAYHLFIYKIRDREGYARKWRSLEFRYSAIDAQIPFHGPDFELDSYYEPCPDPAIEKARKERERKEHAAKEFPRLAAAYFSGAERRSWQTHRDTIEELCILLVRNPEYIERFAALFAEREINPSRDGFFVTHCIYLHSENSDFDGFLPVLTKVLQSTARGLIPVSCKSIRDIPQHQLSAAIIPVLQARTTMTRYFIANGIYAINPYEDDYANCVKAAQWVLGQNDSIDTLLKELKDHAEIHDAAFETLREVTGVRLRSVDEWQAWWGEHRKLEPLSTAVADEPSLEAVMEIRTETSTEETKPEPQRPELVAFAFDGFEPGIGQHSTTGDAKERLLERFGKPPPTDRVQSTIQGEPGDVGLFYTKYWYYDGLEIRLAQRVEAPRTWIRKIILTSAAYKLKFGLSIGTEKSRFLETLGPPDPGVKLTASVLVYGSTAYLGEESFVYGSHASIHILFDQQDRAEKIVWDYYAD